mgnify:CR=1 FL=1
MAPVFPHGQKFRVGMRADVIFLFPHVWNQQFLDMNKMCWVFDDTGVSIIHQLQIHQRHTPYQQPGDHITQVARDRAHSAPTSRKETIVGINGPDRLDNRKGPLTDGT